VDPEKIKAALEAIKNGDAEAALALLEEMIAAAAGGGDVPAEEAPPPDAALAEVAEPAADEEQKAMAAALIKLTGCVSAGEAVAQITQLKARVDALDAERAVLDLSARRELVAELVKLGIEVPATAWQGKPEERKPVKRLADEPLSELRARVAILRATRPSHPQPPTSPALADDARTSKMTPAQKERYEALRASRRSASK
jgi:hypothetical protein